MKKNNLLTVAALKNVLHYDHTTGIFTWKKKFSNCVKQGEQAGFTGKRKDKYIGLNGEIFLAKHLAAFYMTGKWPLTVQFKDGNKNNIKYSNLKIKYTNLELVKTNKKNIHIENIIECMELLWKKDKKFNCLSIVLKILLNDKKFSWAGLFDSISLKSIDKFLRVYIKIIEKNDFNTLRIFESTCATKDIISLENFLSLDEDEIENYCLQLNKNFDLTEKYLLCGTKRA